MDGKRRAVRLFVRVSPELRESLKILALWKGMSVSELARNMLFDGACGMAQRHPSAVTEASRVPEDAGTSVV